MNAERLRYNSHTLSTEQSEGLARFFGATYAWLAGGLAVMGVTAYLTANTPAMVQLLFGNHWAHLALTLGWFAMTQVIQVKIPRAEAGTAANMFLAYSVVTGMTLASVFLLYAHGSLARTFFVTAGTFAGAAGYGMATKRDLGPVGQFMMVGLIGVIVASVVNLFMHSEAIYWVSTYAMVLIFTGLIAYENQSLRRMYAAQGVGGNLAIHGALVLSISFINLFLTLLRFMGDDRRR
jgi:FtsH-binding integral membrane protein